LAEDSARLLTGTQIEVWRDVARPRALRLALMDFDGTLSLIRAGWQRIMAQGMVADLLSLGTGEAEEALWAEVLAMIHRTTGQPTAMQMEAFQALVAARGGQPPTVEACLERYRRDLAQVIAARRQALETGTEQPERYLVPGSLGLLHGLRQRGIGLLLASGTDQSEVAYEAGLLGLTPFFDRGIAGALPAPGKFSKERLVKSLIQEGLYLGEEILAVGDGPVEIAAVAQVGGVTVGVASDEEHPGRLDPDKRQRLVAAGAHVIVADLSEHEALLAYLDGQGA